jgi:signal transduction histidine kinase
MDTVTKLRDNADRFRKIAKDCLIYALLIFAIVFLFYGAESLIEIFLRDIDNVVDVVMAIASTFIFLWLRSSFKITRLSEMLHAQSEERAKDLEVRVAEKTERIRQMHEAQSTFLTEIAHEFQTPISILKGNIAVLAERRTPGIKRRASTERANAIYIATTTLDRLSRLVINLLDIARLNFSKADDGKKEFVALKNLAEEARDDCAILAEDKNISISLTRSTADGEIFVQGKKDKLKEVLLNLLSNALKYTPAGGTISISIQKRNAGAGEEAEIAIVDSGRGISQDILPHIFERFYRIENADNFTGGNGLGLHICRQIVEAHGGTIVAESEPGKGSRFVVHLPMTQPNAAPTSTARAISAPTHVPAPVHAPDGIIKQ